MFFLLSKILYYVIMPAVWLVALLLAAVVVRQPVYKRRLLLAALVVALLGTNPGLANEAMLAWELPAVSLRAVGRHDAGVLLTGITKVNKSPHDRVYLNEGADRLTHTLWLYRSGRIRRIIISGGSGLIQSTARSEAAELAILLRMAGVPKEDVLLEQRSRNTRENALYTKQLLQQHPDIKSLVLITSAFHQRRALGCFRRVGLSPTAFPADFRTIDRSLAPDYWLIPDAGALGLWSTLLHEMVGYATYKLLRYC
ncbi:YdcF family protein [Hymenobacter jejuensis]|uniref:YdcF family protein n=1 Tax=Hymenobacter jejuensis TaxID=2502781 RepID=A0A5B8A6A4_9BACT|nr:YdcF family protein [Hymenobacter jejuensis]QDA62293.1 YdcF family protein [Hymenobacter jejuensis]